MRCCCKQPAAITLRGSICTDLNAWRRAGDDGLVHCCCCFSCGCGRCLLLPNVLLCQPLSGQSGAHNHLGVAHNRATRATRACRAARPAAASSDDGRARARVLARVGVVLKVALRHVVAAHLLPAVLRHVVHCSSAAAGGRTGGQASSARCQCLLSLLLRVRAWRVCGCSWKHAHADSRGRWPRVWPRSPLTVPPLAQSLKVAW